MEKMKQFFNKYIAYIFISPYVLAFTMFITVPVIVAMLLSFTHFNSIAQPTWAGLGNYIALLTEDKVFMQYVLPNTFKFVVIVGIGGYVLSFFLAWCLAQLPPKSRNLYALIIYSPSMTSGVTITVIWKVLFSGDASGYINAMLINWGFITEPIQFLSNPDYILVIMMVVTIWSSMGIGFLAMLAGILNTNQELYEAGSIDGITNRLQEMFYITIPSMKPQMLFGAVMSIVGTFSAGAIGVSLTGSNPTPGYAGQLIVNHIDDYGFLRYEMGYAAAISVFLLVLIYFLSKVAFKIFGEND